MKRYIVNATNQCRAAVVPSAGMLLVKPGGVLGVNQGWV